MTDETWPMERWIRFRPSNKYAAFARDLLEEWLEKWKMSNQDLDVMEVQVRFQDPKKGMAYGYAGIKCTVKMKPFGKTDEQTRRNLQTLEKTMGMYCCCDEKISSADFQCKCEWDGWISTCDWPPERKNKHIPIQMPNEDGIYRTRTQNNSGDRYEEIKWFFKIPFISKGSFVGPPLNVTCHWEGETWEEGRPYAYYSMPIIECKACKKDQFVKDFPGVPINLRADLHTCKQ